MVCLVVVPFLMLVASCCVRGKRVCGLLCACLVWCGVCAFVTGKFLCIVADVVSTCVISMLCNRVV